jgi:thioesterase domain-containing protein
VGIQKEFHQELPRTALLQAPTVEKLAGLLAERAVPWPSHLVALQSEGERPPFFCVHDVGGGVVNLASLASHFAPDHPFYGLQAVGPGTAKGPFTRLEDIAACYLEAVRGVQPAGPYHLGGYSFGGSVALEMAQQLRERGEQVALLAILDHVPPPVRYRRFVWTPTLPFAVARNVVRWVIDDIWRAGPGKRLAALRYKVVLAGIQLRHLFRSRAAACGKTDLEEVLGNTRLPEGPRARAEAHYQALRDYRPRPYRGHVTVFRARTRPLLRYHGWDLGWSRLAGEGVEVVPVPGNHLSMLAAPNVATLARALLARL